MRGGPVIVMFAARWLLLLLVVPLAAPAALPPASVQVTGEALAWTSTPGPLPGGEGPLPPADDITNVSSWLVGEPTRPPGPPESGHPLLERTTAAPRFTSGSWAPPADPASADDAPTSEDAQVESEPAAEEAPAPAPAPEVPDRVPPPASETPPEAEAPPVEAVPPAEEAAPNDHCGLCISLRLL